MKREKKYRFYDLQTCTYSAHDTLQGLTEMLLADVERVPDADKDDLRLLERCRKGLLTEKEMKEIIESYEYEIEEMETA